MLDCLTITLKFEHIKKIVQLQSQGKMMNSYEVIIIYYVKSIPEHEGVDPYCHPYGRFLSMVLKND